MPINREWHEKNKMPENPTHDERMRWHFEHSKHCDCRAMTDMLAKQVEEWSRRSDVEADGCSDKP